MAVLSQPPLLAKKRALVTGGSRGLGRAICAALAAEGARVAFTYSRDEDGARATAGLLALSGQPCLARKASVLDGAATAALVTELEQTWGGIDVLVNGAAASQTLPVALIEEADFDHVMDVNVKGAFLTSRAVLRGMIRRKAGVILNIGSLVARRMVEAPVHYAASKAAVEGMTRSLAREMARHGVRVNCLSPGLLEGGISANIPSRLRDDFLAHCALGRLGGYDEVARLAAFVVSDANPYMTGETVCIDGGL